jgi:hypothetical protein
MRFARVAESIYCDPRISLGQFRVLVNLIGYADRDGACNPSLRKQANDLGRTRSTVRHHLRGLVELRVITSDPMPRRDGSRGANRYTIPAVRELAIDDLQAAVQPAARTEPQTESRPIPATGRRTSSSAGAPADDISRYYPSAEIEILPPLRGGRPRRESRAPHRQRSPTTAEALAQRRASNAARFQTA